MTRTLTLMLASFSLSALVLAQVVGLDGSLEQSGSGKLGKADRPKSASKPIDLTWTTEAWTADETPYVAVRKEVEGYFAGRKPSNRRTDLYERSRLAIVAAKANPTNPVKLFRGAYYAYMLHGLEQTAEARKLVLTPEGSLVVNLASVPSPQSREYSRLRLLIEGGYSKPFLELARRHYKHDPVDVPVAVKLVWIGAFIPGADRAAAVEVAEKLIRTGDPKRFPAIYYACGLAHHTALHAGYKTSHVDRALWAYKQYLNSGPSWRPLVPHVKQFMEGLEKYSRSQSGAH